MGRSKTKKKMQGNYTILEAGIDDSFNTRNDDVEESLFFSSWNSMK
jgi:hypothetical protein